MTGVPFLKDLDPLQWRLSTGSTTRIVLPMLKLQDEKKKSEGRTLWHPTAISQAPGWHQDANASRCLQPKWPPQVQ